MSQHVESLVAAGIFRVFLDHCLYQRDFLFVLERDLAAGSQATVAREEERVVLERPAWSAIADIARREFNDRLKAAKLLTGRWHTGSNLVDRLLGKELCVLAWAAESA